MKAVILFFLSAIFFSCAAHADSIFLLKDYEQRAIENSAKLKALNEDALAVGRQKESVTSTYWPKLSLEGSYRQVTEVPEVTLGPVTKKLGDEKNYSIGPQLTWQVFDRGRDLNSKALSLAFEGKLAEVKNANAQFILAVRSQYIQTQLSLQELKLTEEALKLSENQLKDIIGKVKAGASSQLDKANAERDVSAFRIKQMQALAAAQASLIDFFSLVNQEPIALQDLQLESLEQTQNSYFNVQIKSVDSVTKNSSVKAFQLATDSLQAGADSQAALYLPSLQLYARTSLDFPNGPDIRQINQNTIGANLSWTLFDAGRGSDLKSQKLAEMNSVQFKKQQLLQDLNRDYRKASNNLQLLSEQLKEAEINLKQSQKVAQLFSGSFRAGRLNLLDVQAANLKLLDAGVLKARLQSQYLFQKVFLIALTTNEE